MIQVSRALLRKQKDNDIITAVVPGAFPVDQETATLVCGKQKVSGTVIDIVPARFKHLTPTLMELLEGRSPEKFTESFVERFPRVSADTPVSVIRIVVDK